jgi:hypothetical protein
MGYLDELVNDGPDLSFGHALAGLGDLTSRESPPAGSSPQQSHRPGVQAARGDTRGISTFGRRAPRSV